MNTCGLVPTASHFQGENVVPAFVQYILTALLTFLSHASCQPTYLYASQPKYQGCFRIFCETFLPHPPISRASLYFTKRRPVPLVAIASRLPNLLQPLGKRVLLSRLVERAICVSLTRAALTLFPERASSSVNAFAIYKP